jgi:hypothetical protein
MARNLSFGLDTIMVEATTRSPKWQLLIYDLRSASDTINDVVLFNAFGTGSLDPIVGPRDFTEDAATIKVVERRGDYVNGGIPASQIGVDIVDADGVYDPLGILGLDPSGAEYEASVGRYLRATNAVVLLLGDDRVDYSEWKYVFTGELIGQAGRKRSRSDGAESSMSFEAVGREARFLKYEAMSDDFGGATTFKTAAEDFAQENMGLDVAEIDFSGWGTQTFGHQSVQFLDELPMSVLAQLMFPSGVLPRFDGRGILTQVTSTITAQPDRVYENLDIIRKIDRPFSNVEQANCVTILGLDKEMTKVSQPKQRLATSEITTGWFASDEEIEVYWSDDKTLVAEEVEEKIHKSVTGWLGWLGGGEEFEYVDSPGPGGGTIGCRITISTGFAPWLASYFLAEYVAFAFLPDDVIVVGSGGSTIPIGRVIQATFLIAAMTVMLSISRGQYEFKGSPIEYIYKEIRGQACVEGKTAFEKNTVIIENHMINTQNDVNNRARDTLYLLQAEENPRDVNMLHDLRLEPDDIFEIPGDRSFLIDTISYALIRNERATIASMACFEVTPGVIA